MDAEVEYNNRARVPESGAIIAGWAESAARFRAAHPPETLPYGSGPREAMDLFLPTGTPRGAALMIHGGYWQALGREWGSHWAEGLLAQGVAVALPSYDLCPSVKLARICEQMEAAVSALHARVGLPLLAMGHSAGGHLASWLLARAPHVGAAMPISGLFWLEPLLPTSINVGLRLDATMARDLSPGLWPSPGKPLHCIVGGAESAEFLRQSRDFVQAWGGGFDAPEGLNHFTVLDPLSDPAHPMTRRAAALAGQACGLVMDA
ncbi:alpha/beta hydrolase [Sabulicella rubraurantiaca]|uniref:alpha/beta hydrolase n=1 Tax=Sabulicella rubraurantiaca TaxID=2811429 RepID=UPI001A9701AC|nr:alpha/beta hydrolase [Sabulicella rubraurantiaca]